MISKGRISMFLHPWIAAALLLTLTTAGCNNSSGTGPPGPPASSGTMYVTDFSNNSISIYSQNANCNCAPGRLISGNSTALLGPVGIAVDSVGSMYVTNELNSTISKYQGASSGNAAPVFVIPSSAGLASPIGIAVDGSGKLYVANSAANGGTASIEVFPAGSTTAAQTISGAATGLSNPGFLTLDGAGDIWVANQSTNSVEEFANNANGAASPIAVISGSNTLLSHPQGIAFDSSGRLYVAINNALGVPDAVLMFSQLNGNVAPANILCGPNTGVNNPTGIAVNSLGTVFVVNSAFAGSNGYVTDFAANNFGGGTQCTGPSPNAVVGGNNTPFTNPVGIALR